MAADNARMKTKLLILLALVLFIVLVVGTILLFVLPRSVPGQPSTTTTFPSGGSSGGTTVGTSGISIGIQGGGTLTVKDFMHNGETVADVVNPGGYVLAGTLGYCLGDGSCPAAYKSEDFTIRYAQDSSSFTISLLKEPLGKARLEAEDFLIDRLGISRTQLCSLNYFIGTTYQVNASYSDKHLGFSSCPDAIQLP